MPKTEPRWLKDLFERTQVLRHQQRREMSMQPRGFHEHSAEENLY
jgi:hypothetical protein